MHASQVDLINKTPQKKQGSVEINEDLVTTLGYQSDDSQSKFKHQFTEIFEPSSVSKPKNLPQHKPKNTLATKNRRTYVESIPFVDPEFELLKEIHRHIMYP